MLFSRIFVRVLLLLILMPAAAFGQAQLSQQDRAGARTLMDEGDAKFAARDFEAALKAYQDADRIMEVPTTTIEVGRTLEKLGRLIEARDAFIRVTRYPAKPNEARAFKEARKSATRMAEELAARIPSLEVKVSGAPAGAEVTVTLDGNLLQADLLGLPIKVDPGPHRLEARAPGLVVVEELSVEERETRQVELALKKDESQKSAPPPAPVVEPVAAPEPDKPPSRTLMYVGFGVGAAGLIVGGVTGVMSLSKGSAAKDQCDGTRCPPAAEDDLDSARTLATVSNVGFAVGAIGIGVGVWQLLAAKPAPAEQVGRVRLQPVVGPAMAGIAGNF
jgi:hypothetical protein